MRRALRVLGTLLAAAGVLALLWVFTVWQWQDPFTALYTTWKQHELASQYDRRAANFHAATMPEASLAVERRTIAGEAAASRHETHRGEAIGRIVIGRLHLNRILVDGTDHETLTRGPGRDLRSFMPGQNRLVYVAGHRTTYLAPFSHIDRTRKDDTVSLEVPYTTFVYRVTGHRVVPADDLAVLRSPRHELLELQACHPRFFATHRYIVSARLARVAPRGGTPYDLATAVAVPAQTSGK